MNGEVAIVVQELDDHRVRFAAFCRSLTAEQLGRAVPNSTWIVQDFVAHLGTIDGPVGEMFSTLHEGGDPGFRTPDGARWDVDRWNEDKVQDRRSWSVEQLLAEAGETRAALHAVMAKLTTEDLGKRLKFGGDSKRPAGEVRLIQYMRGWCKHDPMHAVDMARAMPEVLTPEFKAWIDDPVIAGYQASMNRA
jgi:hypothetical protein